jgi:hypothetical protein
MLASCSPSDEDVFAIKVVDDMPRPVAIGLCKDQLCASGARQFTDVNEPGEPHGENVVSDRGLANAFLVATKAGRRVGCLSHDDQPSPTGLRATRSPSARTGLHDRGPARYRGRTPVPQVARVNDGTPHPSRVHNRVLSSSRLSK